MVFYLGLFGWGGGGGFFRRGLDIEGRRVYGLFKDEVSEWLGFWGIGERRHFTFPRSYAFSLTKDVKIVDYGCGFLSVRFGSVEVCLFGIVFVCGLFVS